MDDRTMLELAAKIMGLDSVMEMYGRSEDGSIFATRMIRRQSERG